MTYDEAARLLEKAGCTYDPALDHWRQGDIIIEYKDGRWRLAYAIEDPICGEGDSLDSMLAGARKSISCIAAKYRKLLALFSNDIHRDDFDE